MSSMLTEADIADSIRPYVRLSSRTPEALMQELDSEGWKRVYVDGGKVVQSFLQAGLLSEITLTHIPILIGEGLPLLDISIETWICSTSKHAPIHRAW